MKSDLWYYNGYSCYLLDIMELRRRTRLSPETHLQKAVQQRPLVKTEDLFIQTFINPKVYLSVFQIPGSSVRFNPSLHFLYKAFS